MARDVADRVERGSTDFAGALGDVVGHRKNLRSVLIEEQMVVAKMRPAHVPVEVLRLHVEREHVGQ